MTLFVEEKLPTLREDKLIIQTLATHIFSKSCTPIPPEVLSEILPYIEYKIVIQKDISQKEEPYRFYLSLDNTFTSASDATEKYLICIVLRQCSISNNITINKVMQTVSNLKDKTLLEKMISPHTIDTLKNIFDGYIIGLNNDIFMLFRNDTDRNCEVFL